MFVLLALLLVVLPFVCFHRLVHYVRRGISLEKLFKRQDETGQKRGAKLKATEIIWRLNEHEKVNNSSDNKSKHEKINNNKSNINNKRKHPWMPSKTKWKSQ